jgi:hypothetical protein
MPKTIRDKTVFSVGSSPRIYDEKFQSSIELVVVENWVEFWRWQHKIN